MPKWIYCIIIIQDAINYRNKAELERAKRSFIREEVAPFIGSRRWFFRRVAIEFDSLGWLHPFSLAIYVELLPDDNIECFRKALYFQLVERHRQIGQQGNAVIEVREWDRCFGKDYGGPASQEAMCNFVTEAAPAVIIREEDPTNIAANHASKGIASIRCIAHWWAHLREGNIISDCEAEKIIIERMTQLGSDNS